MASTAVQDPEIGCFEGVESWLAKKHFGRERVEILILFCLIVYTVVFSSLSIYRHYAFNTHAWDLGIFTQSLWTTLNANRFLYYTCELIVNPSGSFFGVHFSPILALILPIYGAIQFPETLLVIQSFILSLASIPIYKLAREKTGKRTIGMVFALAYFMYPAVQHVNVYEFHVQALLPLFFGCMIYFMSKEDWPKYFMFVFLALMCEEHVAWIVFFVGLYIGWRHRKEIINSLKRKAFTNRKLIIVCLTLILSLAWYLFTLWQRDTFFPVNPDTMVEFLGSGNFRILGASNPMEVPILIILRPLNAIEALAYDGFLKLSFLFFMFGPLAFLSLKSPSSLIPTVPFFIFSLFSQSTFHHTLGTQYPTYLTFFIFAAAIFGFSRTPRNIKRSLVMIIGSSLVFLILISPLSPTVALFPTNYEAASFGNHERMLHEVLETVPKNASILTQDNIFPHVSHRVEAYVIPDRWIHSGDIQEIALEFVNQTIEQVEYVLVDSKTNLLAYETALLMLSTKPQFALETSRDDGTILLYHQEFS
jgi:uncharacterized membrane protein